MGFLCKYFYPKALGIIVTASHNPMKDNGIKLLDGHGGYLRINLERYFNVLVNEKNLEKAI
jgi:phosphoacetylglucosamine mutase